MRVRSVAKARTSDSPARECVYLGGPDLPLFSRLRVPAATIPSSPASFTFWSLARPPAVALPCVKDYSPLSAPKPSEDSQQTMPGLLSPQKPQVDMKQTAGETVFAEKANLREQFGDDSVASTDSSDSSTDAHSLCVPEIVVTPPSWPSSADGGLMLDFSCQGWYVPTDCRPTTPSQEY